MICPKCQSEKLKVLESRSSESGTSIRRRRECEDCKHRFTTFERIDTTNFVVVKKDETREPYNREKLERSIWIACSKRPVTKDQVDEVIRELEKKWSAMGKEVVSDTLGRDVMEEMKKLDDIAYIRFASVYRDFRDIETFREELVDFLKRK